MSMCPYPTCEYNERPRCGTDFCILPACLYPAACRRAITEEINRIIEAGRSESLAERLEQLKAERDAVDGGST